MVRRSCASDQRWCYVSAGVIESVNLNKCEADAFQSAVAEGRQASD